MEAAPPPQATPPTYWQQPSAVAPMVQQPGSPVTVVVMAPPAAAPPSGQQQNVRPWSSGICGCFEDCFSCCCACCCFPYYMCTLARELDEYPCGPYCCGFGRTNANCAGGPPNMFTVAMRTKLRTKYGIQGSICDDIICMCCCELCAITQMDRELRYQRMLRMA